MQKYITYLSVLLIFSLSTTLQAKTTIDIMALYSQAVTATTGSQANAETTIRHMLNVANGVYNDSPPSDVELRLVHIQESDLLDDDATTINVLQNGVRNATFQALRDQHGADAVVMFRPYRTAERGLCGTAFLLGLPGANFANAAYAHVSLGGICPTSVTAHELGHTQGLSHSHLQDDRANGSTASRRPYSLGHGVDGSFATIMAYDFLFNTRNTIYKHSSPNLDCNGLPCGIPVGQTGEADAVLALTEFAPNVANYRETQNTDGGDGGDGGTDGGDGNTDGDDGSTDDGDGTGGGDGDDGDTSETELERAKRLFEEAQAAFLLVRDVYIEKRNTFRSKRNDYRAARRNFRIVRRNFRRGTATRAELNSARAALRTARAERNAARADLIDYRNTSFLPARSALREARRNYRNLLAGN